MTVFSISLCFRKQVCKQLIEIMRSAEAGSCSDLTKIIETTAAPVGLNINKGLLLNQNDFHSSSIRMGINQQQQPSFRTESQTLSTQSQTLDSKQSHDTCPMDTKINPKDEGTNIGNSQSKHFTTIRYI